MKTITLTRPVLDPEMYPTWKSLYRHPLWQKRSDEIKIRDNYTCQYCGCDNVQVFVHHIKYLIGWYPWEHPDELLITVCLKCHRKIHGKQDDQQTEINFNQAA